MTDADPRSAGDVPPERRSEENPSGAEPRGRDDGEPRGEKSPSTPGPESVPTEEDLKEDLPGTPEEQARDRGDE